LNPETPNLKVGVSHTCKQRLFRNYHLTKFIYLLNLNV
jgi:hypothetical protein